MLYILDWKKCIAIIYRAIRVSNEDALIMVIIINPLECFVGSEGHVAPDRNPGPGYNTLLLR